MNIIRKISRLLMVVLLIFFSIALAVASLIVLSLIDLFSSFSSRFKKEEINEHGFVEKAIN